jgi:hypothetical protein
MAAPIGIDIRDKKLVFNDKIRIFERVLGSKSLAGNRGKTEELLIVGLHNFSFEN